MAQHSRLWKKKVIISAICILIQKLSYFLAKKKFRNRECLTGFFYVIRKARTSNIGVHTGERNASGATLWVLEK